MTVTTNTLGTNSAEIVVFNHARYYDALTAVGSFLTSHGWTEKAGVGNALEKVYTSNNTLGSGVKEIKINAETSASAQWELLKQFLNENCSTYPLWHVSQSRTPNRPKIRGIKRTIN